MGQDFAMDSISLLVYSARQAVAVKNFTHNTVLLCSAVQGVADLVLYDKIQVNE